MSRESITRIKVVYDALEELANEVVFVGGAGGVQTLKTLFIY